MDDVVRQRVLEAASTLLVEEGPSGLRNRRIAERAGTTTMAIYSRFGSKGGILEALHREGVAALTDAQDRARATSTDPLERVHAMCVAFRQLATQNQGHYRLVFGAPIEGFEPSPDARAGAAQAFQRLAEALLEAWPGIDAEAAKIASYELFSACHGFVSLELGGFTELLGQPAEVDQAYRRLVERMLVPND